jgi:hypothetical protein
MPGFEVSEAPRRSFIEAYNNKSGSIINVDDYASENFADEDAAEDSETVNDTSDELIDKSDETDDVLKFTRHETANVRTWRFILLGVIITTGAIVTALTYIFLKQDEEDDSRTSVRILK